MSIGYEVPGWDDPQAIHEDFAFLDIDINRLVRDVTLVAQYDGDTERLVDIGLTLAAHRARLDELQRVVAAEVMDRAFRVAS